MDTARLEENDDATKEEERALSAKEVSIEPKETAPAERVPLDSSRRTISLISMMSEKSAASLVRGASSAVMEHMETELDALAIEPVASLQRIYIGAFVKILYTIALFGLAIKYLDIQFVIMISSYFVVTMMNWFGLRLLDLSEQG